MRRVVGEAGPKCENTIRDCAFLGIIIWCTGLWRGNIFSRDKENLDSCQLMLAIYLYPMRLFAVYKSIGYF